MVMFLGKDVHCSEIFEIRLESYSVVIATNEIAISILTEFSLIEDGQIYVFDPEDKRGELRVLWRLIGAKMGEIKSDPVTFSVSFDGGGRLEVVYGGGNEQVNVWGPGEDVVTYFPAENE